MNTRLQVEHPVTEMITGLDLVAEQIKVARGEKLSFAQEDLKINGHAFEVRVYAEDPENNFLPDIGKLSTYRLPKGEGIRVDDSMEEGMNIPIYYDPMISKLIAWGKSREEAIERMLKAIDDYQINGVETTLSFCRFAINHDAFRRGEFDTHFVAKYFDPKNFRLSVPEEEKLAALISANLTAQRKGRLTVGAKEEVLSPWRLNRI
jgi:acetyl/propionyl-CoA carboxylase alpha subunit